MKIIILDGYSVNPGDLSWKELEAMGELVVHDRTAPSQIEVRARDADALLTNKVPVSAETMDRLPRLRYIGVLATGYNVVDTAAARERGITVTNIPAYSTDSVAQMTFAHILNITNRVAHYGRQNREQRWSRSADFCYWDTALAELAGKTLGIIGMGRIGTKVAEIARCFGMEVIAFTHRPAADLPEGVSKTDLESLWPSADVITLHCPLTEASREIVNANALERVKTGAILINTGRGPLVNEADVAQALHAGKLGGFGADVLCQEPPREDNPLFKAPNCFITPHIAWATPEARRRLMAMAAENLRAYLAGKPINVVN